MNPEWTIKPKRPARTYLAGLLRKTLSHLPEDSLGARRLAEDIRPALKREEIAQRKAARS